MNTRLIAAASVALPATGYLSVLAAKLRLRQWESLDPDATNPPGDMLSLDGVPIHFQEAGRGTAGTPLLLIHGFGASTFSFRHQLAPLSHDRRLLALDLPGFGYSDRSPDIDLSHTAQAERVRAFLDRMEVGRAIVLGHSMGGAIAMRLAATHPQRVERLILVASAPSDRPLKLPLYPLLRPLMPVPLALIAREQRLRSELRRIVHDPSVVTGEMEQGYIQPLRLRGTARCLTAMLGAVRRDQPVNLASIRTPAHLLWGDTDPVVSRKEGERQHAALPDSHLHVIPTAGHLPLEEHPDLSTNLIRDILELTPAPARR